MPQQPAAETDNAPYWEALSHRVLSYQRCTACQRAVFYPRARCPHCFSDQLEWHASAGRGSVYAVTTVHRAPRAFESRAPFCVALIDLDEGFRMLSNLVSCSPGQARIGMAVQLDFEERDETLLPVFRPVFRPVVSEGS